MRWFALILVTLLGLYIMTWAFQNAWISSTPVSNPEIYKTRALFLLPMSLIILIQGVILFLKIGKGKKEE
jgi:hypothetical protein